MRAVFFLLLTPLVAFAGPRVDISQDSGRADVLAPGWQHLRGTEKPAETASAKFGDTTVTLRAVGKGATLTAGWWKPGFDYPARMASDGVVATGALELVLAGLPPGRHSLASYHNLLTDAKPGKITVTVGSVQAPVTPSVRATDDFDAASAFVTFDAEAGKDVVVTFTGESGVILNGFELDRSDPAKRAGKPFPITDDEHVADNPVLKWRAGVGATAHRVYLGTDPSKLELVGETKEPTFATAKLKLNHYAPYFWRVDEVHTDGVVTGEVWRFRVRHLAFPEAEGYGRFAIGGRGGKVYEVTNLDDSGPGSLREAIEASGPRTVVFRVGGLIELKSKLVFRNPYLTVAGQTAPGDGICIKNYTFGGFDTHDTIIRHVRIRVGDETGTTNDGCGARGSDHMIFDHCSISWSIDEGFSSREAKNITVQRCLIAEALNIADHKKYQPGKGHSFAGSISGGVGSFHHNLLAHCTGRNWSLAGGLDRSGVRLAGQLDLRNNVVYNWRDRTTDGGVRELNFVNNFYLPGPATKTFTMLKPDPNDWDRGMRAFMAGNVIDGKPEFDADNWKAFIGPADGLAMVKQVKPLFDSFVKTHSAKEAYTSVIADVGATKPKQDAVDKRVIADVEKRGHTFTGSKGKLPGIIDSPKDAGGWPEYKSGDAPTDADHDGIPDEWEKSHGLDPKNAADGNGYRRDGYTHLEHYLNELADPTTRPSADPKYHETIHKRATAAVASAKVDDATKRDAAVKVVESHYVGINEIHFDRDEAVKVSTDEKAVTAARETAAKAVAAVHATFTKELAVLLATEQCEAVKDAMTYGVRTNTFRVYCEMLPKLTNEEKQALREFLMAGREEALVAGGADEKHEKFRIAKEKIANYLSKRGYDMKAAEKEWAEKRKKEK
jgi:Protein of unknown function (DUF3826)